MTKTSFAAALFISIVLPLNAQAIKILQVKGQKVLIDLEGSSAFSGDKFFALDSAGKRKALLTIVQTKSGKAVANVEKGTPQAGYTLNLARASTGPKSTSSDVSASPSRSRRSSVETLDGRGVNKLRASWGLLADIIMGSMSASFSGSVTETNKTTTMTGTNFGFGGYYDMLMGDSTSIRLYGSYQMFNLKGNTTENDCDGSNNCNVTLNYLSGYGLYRYHFSTGKIATWAGAGGGILVPMGSSSNVINTKKASFNYVVSAAFGLEYQLNPSSYIPFSFEYHYFPSTKSVESNMMIMRVGYGWYF